jgi:hypothetical protein
MAVISFPSRTVRCIRWSASRRPRYQPIGLPMDDTACFVHDECYDLHYLLRKYPCPRDNKLHADNIQADSLEVLVIGQAFEGVPWGFFIANSPAYASEIVPLALRSACAATLQMSWAIGSIIVAGISYAYNQRDDQWSWRMPAALQWIFPVSVVQPPKLISYQTNPHSSPSSSSSSSLPSLHGGSSAAVAKKKPSDPSNASATTPNKAPPKHSQ